MPATRRPPPAGEVAVPDPAPARVVYLTPQGARLDRVLKSLGK